ncbi:MAG: serine hydrolase domain-containing protein [Bacteroidota bacterium]
MKTPKTTHRWGAIQLIPLFILVLFLSTCDTIRSPTSAASTNPLSSSELQEIVEQEMALQNILGVAVGVVEDRVITHVESFDHLDEARTEPVTKNTVFRYASVSKSVTAIALFKAITEGHLGLMPGDRNGV